MRSSFRKHSGIKEKVLAAKRAGIKTIILPERNRKDLMEDIPAELRKGMSFIFAKNVADVQERSGLKPETAVRLIETRSGILLVPLTDTPMSTDLIAELQDWQSLGQEAWELFSYDEDEV